MIRAGAMEEDGIPRQTEWERRERERGGEEGGRANAGNDIKYTNGPKYE